MPKPKQRVPDGLRPYLFHGVELTWRDGDKDAAGDCPLCGRDGKFGIDLSTGKYNCFKCDAKGNPIEFLRWLWRASDEATTDYQHLAEHRGLQSETLMRWEVVRSITTNEWLIPGYNAQGKLNQLYRYYKGVLLATPTFKQQLHGVNLYDRGVNAVYLCEGPWDGMALWEILRQAKPAPKESPETLVATANAELSLLNDAGVLAAPGCNIFRQEWMPLFADKEVNLMYDNDHPRKHPKSGKSIEPVGYQAMRRVAGLLAAANNPPAAINYLCWGKDGYNSDLPSGHDVRDYLNA